MSQMNNENKTGPASSFERRDFLKLMGASMALAGATACRWPEEEILPANGRPEGHAPGETMHYTTAMELGGAAIGLLVTCVDGRPIKIEGNPNHPINKGATNAYAQAAILDLYDPDRSKTIIRRDASGRAMPQAWDDFLKFAKPLFETHRRDGGRGLRVLSGAYTGPSMWRLRQRFLQELPQARWSVHEPVEALNGAITVPDVAGAQIIVSLDCDFLHFHPAASKNARDFAQRRRALDGRLNTLYVVESAHSLTGAMATRRMALPPSQIPALAAALAVKLAEAGMRQYSGAPLPAAMELDGRIRAWLDELVRGMMDAPPGSCLVLAGHSQPASIHALAHHVNVELGAGAANTAARSVPSGMPLPDLARELENGSVETLLVLESNPAYSVPAFDKLIGKAVNSIHVGLYEDETGAACQWHLPQAHFLESWGDAAAADGTVSIVQPMIRPLYGGKTALEMASLVLGQLATAYEIVRETFAPEDAAWRKALLDGVAPDDMSARGNRLVMEPPDAPEPAGGGAAPAEALEIIFRPSYCVYDGRFANNGWLHELPDPITKIVWDNPAVVSPVTAEKYGWDSGDVIAIDAGGDGPFETPVLVLPGVADNTLVMTLGYGRRRTGQVGTGVGVNAFHLMHRLGGQLWAAPDQIRKTGQTHTLASTQDQHAISLTDQRKVGSREIVRRLPELVRETTLAELSHHATPTTQETQHHGTSEHGMHPAPDLWRPHTYDGYRWGMTIDLAACIGCNACVVACYAENNIPVVGPEETERGRDMAWLRVDRYFKPEGSDPGAARILFQPVACHHCETAPCEQVCPVNATVHDSEGLNAMVYNRCIGTRYCSNNCPYKVRRFNYFNNNKNLEDVEKMKFNPDVTVRARGVMEKCTYCVQRIVRARIDAKNERRSVADGEVRTACQQACPTQAIVFGDLNDPNSQVAKLQHDPRAYALLGELNTRPRTMYLAKVKQG